MASRPLAALLMLVIHIFQVTGPQIWPQSQWLQTLQFFKLTNILSFSALIIVDSVWRILVDYDLLAPRRRKSAALLGMIIIAAVVGWVEYRHYGVRVRFFDG